MIRPAIGHLAFETGPVPHFSPTPRPEPSAPAPAAPLAEIAAGLETLRRRASLAARDDRMHPLGVRDADRLHHLLSALRPLASAHPHPLPELVTPPRTRALALPDLLPCLAAARDTVARLQARADGLARLQRAEPPLATFSPQAR